jgi:D-tyrosyl-tRNA(Tyr) deacylase
MRLLIQRVRKASVHIEGQVHAQIQTGLVVLVGFASEDTEEDVAWGAKKLAAMRIFPGSAGSIDASIQEAQGSFLVVSQFTLHASTKKGNRPSFYRAAPPHHAIPLYEAFLEQLWTVADVPVKSGVFGADMQVELVNDGPVTIWLDTQNRE